MYNKNATNNLVLNLFKMKCTSLEKDFEHKSFCFLKRNWRGWDANTIAHYKKKDEFNKRCNLRVH